MANRPVFLATKDSTFFKELPVEFQFYNGFAEVQKQKSIQSLHEAFLKLNPSSKVLEISTKSTNFTGVMLSAFNLKIMNAEGDLYPLESAFQGGKVFEQGGPYRDILTKAPWEAKKDPRLKSSGNIIAFSFDGKNFPISPTTFFYDWLYINAVNQNQELKEAIMQFDAFTDIEFNPKKSLNCQARSAAIFVSLVSAQLLSDALESPETFKTIVYFNAAIGEQISFI